MNITILGSGLMGAKLGVIFAQVGHKVIFSYARTQQKLESLARQAGHNARFGTPAEAARDADVVLLAVHWLRLEDVLAQAGDLAGKVVVSCMLPLNADNIELVVGYDNSGAEVLQKKLPMARIVSAFHTVPSEAFFDVFERRNQPTRPSLLYSGDDEGAKKVAAELICDVGYEPVDCGRLQMARNTEPFARIVGQLAYRSVGGPSLTYRFDKF